MKVVILYEIDNSWDELEKSDSRESFRVLDAALKNEGIHAHMEELTDSRLDLILDRYNPDDTIIFNLCEGIPGIHDSERLVLEMIERKGFTFTGNSSRVIVHSYDKQKTRRLMQSHGVRVPQGAVLTPEQASGWKIFPSIVKASREHCSRTISEKSVVFDTSSLVEQILLVNRELDQPALVEEFIDGREFLVTVWNNNPPEMLPPVEMDFSAFSEIRQRICTYDSKFRPGTEHYEKIGVRVPSLLGQGLSEELERIVISAWNGFGCQDYARMDFRLRDNKFYLLDINPNNDLSSDTTFALAAEKSNYTYGQLLKRIIMMAAERHPVFCELKRYA